MTTVQAPARRWWAEPTTARGIDDVKVGDLVLLDGTWAELVEKHLEIDTGRAFPQEFPYVLLGDDRDVCIDDLNANVQVRRQIDGTAAFNLAADLEKLARLVDGDEPIKRVSLHVTIGDRYAGIFTPDLPEADRVAIVDALADRLGTEAGQNASCGEVEHRAVGKLGSVTVYISTHLGGRRVCGCGAACDHAGRTQ